MVPEPPSFRISPLLLLVAQEEEAAATSIVDERETTEFSPSFVEFFCFSTARERWREKKKIQRKKGKKPRPLKTHLGGGGGRGASLPHDQTPFSEHWRFVVVVDAKLGVEHLLLLTRDRSLKVDDPDSAREIMMMMRSVPFFGGNSATDKRDTGWGWERETTRMELTLNSLFAS